MLKIIISKRALLKYTCLVFASLVIGCGGGGENNKSDKVLDEVYIVSVAIPNLNSLFLTGGTLFSIKNESGQTVAAAGFPRTWNTYCQNTLNQLQFYVTNPLSPIKFETIKKPDLTFRSGYGITNEDGIFAWDMAIDQFYKLNPKIGENSFQASNFFPCDVDEFKSGDYTFKYEYSDTQNTRVLACNNKSGICDIAEIAPSTIVYTFASSGNSVLAISNWGDILRFTKKGGVDAGWVRAVKVGTKFTFPSLNLGPPIISSTGIQFYSSIDYNGKTLLGEYPNGALFEYNGSEIIPWAGDRPVSTRPYRSEAQSMAIYCGDLYVGYWPRGELWRLSDGVWNEVKRMFSHPSGEIPFEPYEDRPNNPFVSNFYGQRITALSNFDKSMYAFTSNKKNWFSYIDFSGTLTPDQADEYGAIHKITKDSCSTGWLPNLSGKQVLRFEITKSMMIVSLGNKKILSVENTSGIVPSAKDAIVIGEGVFGASNKSLFSISK